MRGQEAQGKHSVASYDNLELINIKFKSRVCLEGREMELEQSKRWPEYTRRCSCQLKFLFPLLTPHLHHLNIELE